MATTYTYSYTNTPTTGEDLTTMKLHLADKTKWTMRGKNGSFYYTLLESPLDQQMIVRLTQTTVSKVNMSEGNKNSFPAVTSSGSKLTISVEYYKRRYDDGVISYQRALKKIDTWVIENSTDISDTDLNTLLSMSTGLQLSTNSTAGDPQPTISAMLRGSVDWQ